MTESRFNSFACWLAILAGVALSGCATRTASIHETSGAGELPAATAAESPPGPLPDIGDVARDLTHHPRALWQSKTAGYQFFIGGVLNANYSPGDQILTLEADGNNAPNVACKYGMDNRLTLRAVEGVKFEELERTCDKLLRELAKALSR